MARYVITGGAGFIGTNLCLRLLADGHQVVAIDNLCTGSRANLTKLKANRHFEFLEADVTQPFTLKGEVAGIYHLASPASPIDFDRLSLEILKVNIYGTEKMCDLAREKGAFMLLASTSEVYGDAQVHPQPETYWGHVNPNGPRSCYDEAKRAAESMVVNYTKRQKVKTAIVRIFNTYGPYMRLDDGRVVTNFIEQALRGKELTVYGDGNHTRCLCYVDDLVDAIVRAGKVLHPEPINIGSDQELTVIEIANMVKRLTNSNSKIAFKPLPQDDPKLRRPVLTRAQTILEWQPRISLELGLLQTIDYIKTLLK